MAAATETLGGRLDSFDWERAEAEIAELLSIGGITAAASYLRPPESEIYGRSLSTPHRLGMVAVEATLAEATVSPEAAQAWEEFATSVEEGLATDGEHGEDMEVRDFEIRPVINRRVTAKDLKTPISSMTEAGLKCALAKVKQEMARGDRRFIPELIRAYWEHKHALAVDAMANGETDYDTIIVASPFTEEAAAESGDEYWRDLGYVPHLKRGFVWLYHVSKDGAVLAGTLSFSGSNKQRLRKIFRQFGKEIPEDATTDNWLKYAITGNMSADEAKALATKLADLARDPSFKRETEQAPKEKANTVDMTEQHKPLIDRAFNESYVHICESLARGYQTEEARQLIYQFANKAHNFNERYATALYRMRADGSRFGDEDFIVLHELLVYSTIEMIRALHLQIPSPGHYPEYGEYGNDNTAHAMSAYLQSLHGARFQDMLGNFGVEGARNNRTYSACGLAISLGGKADKKKDGTQAVSSNTNSDRERELGDADEGEDSSEDVACDYEHTGCYCSPYNHDGSSRSTPMKVTARREADGTAHCQRAGCGAWLSADGKRWDIGLIARKARRSKRSSYALAA